MPSQQKILVYHHRANPSSPILPSNPTLLTENALADLLSKHPTLRSTRKPLARGAKAVDVYQHDVNPEADGEPGGHHPNAASNVAGVRVPVGVWVKGLVTGAPRELVVLSERV